MSVLVMGVVVLHYQKMGQRIVVLKRVIGGTSTWTKRLSVVSPEMIVANVISESYSPKVVIPEHALLSDFLLHKQSASFSG